MNRDSLVPLTGVLFVALVVIGFIVQGEPPGADDGAAEITEFYADNEGSVTAGIVMVALAALAFVFFAGYLRKVLSAAIGDSMLPGLVLVGASIFAVGIAIDASITLALVEESENIEPAGVEALQALWENDFVPFAMGTVIFALSTGIAVVRSGALPKWLGWVAILLAVVGVTPVGWVAALAMGVWIVVVSLLLSVRGGATA